MAARIHSAALSLAAPTSATAALPRRALLGSSGSEGGAKNIAVPLVGRHSAACEALKAGGVRSAVQYGTSPGQYDHQVEAAEFHCYSTPEYDSGALHHVVIGAGDEGPLPFNTTIYYRCGDPGQGEGAWSDERSFVTAPRVGADSLPYRLGLIGDLGQTEDSLSTLEHLEASQPDSVLLVGDLSYADGEQPRWDSWGRMVDPVTSKVVWMFTEGNHEIENRNDEPEPFLAYRSRFHTPSRSAGSESPLYYSYEVAGAHVILLGSYDDARVGSDQYRWLVADLAVVDRERTPWLIAAMHAPFYNSNENHQGEAESMRRAMESLLYDHGVDLVFAGHVHAYERSHRVFDNRRNDCGPMYINVGDGGNREGLDTHYLPRPEWSAFREPSFGHGVLDLQNATFATFSWYRNQDATSEAAEVVPIQRMQACKARHSRDWVGSASSSESDEAQQQQRHKPWPWQLRGAGWAGRLRALLQGWLGSSR